jgi:hypothetical protein
MGHTLHGSAITTGTARQALRVLLRLRRFTSPVNRRQEVRI